MENEQSGGDLWVVKEGRHEELSIVSVEFAEWGGVKNEQQRTENGTFRNTACR